MWFEVKGSGNVVLNPAVVKGEGKYQNRRKRDSMKIGLWAELDCRTRGGGALAQSRTVRGRYPIIGTLWLKAETVGHWYYSHYWPWFGG